MNGIKHKNRMNLLQPFLAVLGCFFLVNLAGLNLRAQGMSADEIVKKANIVAYYAGADGRSSVRLTIVDPAGNKRYRQFNIVRRDVTDAGDQLYLVHFSRPADVRNTVFLVKKRAQGDDDRWLYLPDLDLVKRISAGDKRTSFVGSHFLYEDVSGRRVNDDAHKLVETTSEHYVIENTPKDKSGVEFSSWKVWIDKKTFLPVKMEYTDGGGKVYRRIEAVETEVIQGHPTVTKMKVSDLANGGYTLAELRNIAYDIDVPESAFAEKSLRNPPMSLLTGRGK